MHPGSTTDTNKTLDTAALSDQPAPNSQYGFLSDLEPHLRRVTDPTLSLEHTYSPATAGQSLAGEALDLRLCINLIDLPNEILIHSLSHLSPADLLSTALVCHRLHDLVTHPDAWRTAFTRYFGGSKAPSTRHITALHDRMSSSNSTKRYFTRLTSFSSWRAEYTVRVRLLNSLLRGRPVLAGEASPPGIGRRLSTAPVAPVVLSDTELSAAVTMIHANFDAHAGRRQQNMLFASGFNGDARLMDPLSGKMDRSWSTRVDINFRRTHLTRFSDHELYGMGAGQFVCNPNPADIARPYGVVVGEGFPDGHLTFRPINERAMYRLQTSISVTARNGTAQGRIMAIPRVPSDREGISAIWIAKTANIPSLSAGMIGIMSGSSLGIVSSYSLGHVGMRDRSITRGELTARWVLSPGVPIIALVVDDNYTLRRHSQNRIWAVAVNAFGEVFYLTKFPNRIAVEKRPVTGDRFEWAELTAWLSARSVSWNLVEATRRVATPDPYGDYGRDASYSPRSSWNGMCLTEGQIMAEAFEISTFLHRRPCEFQQECVGWDMQRKVEVDFAGDDGNHAGEAILVVTNPTVRATRGEPGAFRYVRVKTQRYLDGQSASAAGPSDVAASLHALDKMPSNDLNTPESLFQQSCEEWLTSKLNFVSGSPYIISSAIDCSRIANYTLSEDPMVTLNSSSSVSSGSSTPSEVSITQHDAASIPGQRARLVALGTDTGMVYVWNLRAPLPASHSLHHVVEPIRVIEASKSCAPITCLAINSLAVFHGDEEGLVQAWDPLCSQGRPLRTISSPFTGQMRRKILAAQSVSEDNNSLASARAIVLDPDSTILRGIVAIGTHIKHWHFRSEDISGFGARGGKRKRHKSSRNSNAQSPIPPGTAGRGGINGFIEDEIRELSAERRREAQERARMQQRFGVGMLGEEEELRLAMLLSEETFEFESQSERSTPQLAPVMARPSTNDDDIAEAIRRSLQNEGAAPSHASTDASSSNQDRSTRLPVGRSTSFSANDEASDLELALMLSIADQHAHFGS